MRQHTNVNMPAVTRTARSSTVKQGNEYQGDVGGSSFYMLLPLVN